MKNEDLKIVKTKGLLLKCFSTLRLEGLAKVALLQNNSDHAVRLYGAARHLFQGLANTMSPLERQWREDDLASIRAILGNEYYQSLWDEGFALTTEEAVKLSE
jgi:hypothetical protein